MDCLDFENSGNLPLWINPEMRVVDSRPRIAAGRTQVRVLFVGSGDLKTEPEFVAAGADRKIQGARGICRYLGLDDHAADFILGHGLDRGVAQQGCATPSPVVQEHLKEFDVIGSR